MVPNSSKIKLSKRYPLIVSGYKDRQTSCIFELYLFMLYILIALSIGFLFD